VAQQDTDPADEPEAAPAGDEPAPEGFAASDAPPLQRAPARRPLRGGAPDADTTFGSAGQIAISDDWRWPPRGTSVAGSSGAVSR
jgi:hypothetical protein